MFDAHCAVPPATLIQLAGALKPYDLLFLEEPAVPGNIEVFKRLKAQISIPLAAGERDRTIWEFVQYLQNRCLDIVQPDLHYDGGFIRATQVARMAAAAGLSVVPHMSGGGLGYLDVIHFASFTPNAGAFMEFKGNASLPVSCETSSLRCESR